MNDKMIIKAEGAELYLERTFAAPRELVWAAFTECEHLKHWWGPHGWDLTHCEMDFRPGGRWHYMMSGPGEDGKPMESWGLAEYEAISAPDSFMYKDAFSDSDGNKTVNMPVADITNEFIEVEGGTKVVSRTVYPAAEHLQTIIEMGVEQGITETWDRLVEYLKTAGE
ncbi:MAG: SRPBCC domain-containing protein [Anaerolineales bacterium]|nr:SRPBCC domain-containing protein [Anaerolineales bacterium]MCW5856524.1 SRPBCC domain-containing protein [Anaerolineales bacterium]